MKKRKDNILSMIAIVFIVTSSFASAWAQEDCPEFTIELNLVFLHGAPGEPLSMGPLETALRDSLAPKITAYEQSHPGMNIEVNTWIPDLDNDESVSSWANNIATFINDNLPNKENIILIGHSMGGKSAIYAVKNNVGGLQAKTLAVVTINSPIEEMDHYVTTGGFSIWENFCGAWFTLSGHDTQTGDNGVCTSVAHHDSRDEAIWIAQNKHLLMFISGEDGGPNSTQCNSLIGDGLPRDQDDELFPISAQNVPEADVVYYGNYCHSALHDNSAATNFMAETISNYIFGDVIHCSVLVREGSYDNKADIYPGTDSWEDIRGDVLACEGSWIEETCNSIPTCSWNPIVGCNPCPGGDERSYCEVSKDPSSDLSTWINTYGWESSDVNDCRIYVDAGAAYRNWLKINWRIYGKGLLPTGTPRDHYEVRVIDADDPGTGTSWVRWETSAPNDCRIRISSWAWSPNYWIRIGWRVYKNESRQISLISDMISDATLPAAVSNGTGGPLMAKHYLVTGIVYIPSGSMLTINAGAKLYFESGSKIIANGIIEVNGESGIPICLVSLAVPHRGIKLMEDLVLKNGGELKPGQ
jgi:pimeloyl-ACP methyl ester carboxylesterase